MQHVYHEADHNNLSVRKTSDKEGDDVLAISFDDDNPFQFHRRLKPQVIARGNAPSGILWRWHSPPAVLATPSCRAQLSSACKPNMLVNPDLGQSL